MNMMILYLIFLKKNISIGFDLQILLRNKFFDFFDNYYALINKFIDLNNYIIKVKLLFNMEE